MFDLTDKVAVVTGAAQGMGRAMAIALAEAGANLLVVDRNELGVTRTAAEITDMGRRAIAVACDVSEPVQVRMIFARLDSEFRRIDFLAKWLANQLWRRRRKSVSRTLSRSGAILFWAASVPVRKRVEGCSPPGAAAL